MNVSSETSTAPIILATSFLSLFKIIVVGKPLKRNKFTNLFSESKNIDKFLISKLLKKISVLR
ncbi:uncharacterized protein METZ01_LOCUS238574 [marine metagenome]|uniref:Uncharacterized protein n=1 Tax=marine metagenome TaxID=408172 RepID=A0A382HEJ4_9ZZZZ